MKVFAHPLATGCDHPLCQGGQTCEALFDSWDFKVECMGAPLAITGTASGHPFYFRARHDHWRLELRDEIIASGDTDDFAVWTAIELIMRTINQWIWQDA